MNSEILKAGESFIHRTSPESSIRFLLPLFSPSLFCIHHHPSHSSRLRFFHQHLASAIKRLLIFCRRTEFRSKTAEPKDRAATDQSDRRSRTQIRSRLTTLAISEDISVIACGSHLRLLLPVHPSTNTSPHAPRSAVVFPRTQHRVATGQSDRILLLESIENIKICPQWTLRSSSPYTGHQQSLARTHFIHQQTRLVKLHPVVIIPNTDLRQKLSRLGILAIGTSTCRYLQPLLFANCARRLSSDTKLDCQLDCKSIMFLYDSYRSQD